MYESVYQLGTVIFFEPESICAAFLYIYVHECIDCFSFLHPWAQIDSMLQLVPTCNFEVVGVLLKSCKSSITILPVTNLSVLLATRMI